MIQHILVATDLSPSAQQAYRHAALLGRAFKARVTVLHVDELTERSLGAFARLKGFVETSAEDRERELREVADRFAELEQTVECAVESGPAARTILAYAQAHAADLVVVSKQGRRTGNPLWVGSTSETVMHESPVPVLIALGEGEGKLPAYRKILLTTDYSADSDLGVRRIVALTEPFGTEIEVVHAVPAPGLLPSNPLAVTRAVPTGALEAYRARYEEELSRHVAGLHLSRVTGKVALGDTIIDAIAEHAVTTQADLIAMPSHGKGALERLLLGSTTRQVVRLAGCPVLVMPRAWLRGAASSGAFAEKW